MDTRFWGPSGWKLLHLIAASTRANQNHTFWEMLPYVLPCKFCRASLSTYYEEYPIPTKQEDFAQWLYIIHNCVNQKLREQGQQVAPDPPLGRVLSLYEGLLQQGCTKTNFSGWEFLFSIADNHPSSSPSSPMPDVPQVLPSTLSERNKYNLLTPAERKPLLKKFWAAVPDVLPFEEWRSLWNKSAKSVQQPIKGRKQAVAWLWRIRCTMDDELYAMAKHDFYGLCKVLRNHRSGCSTNRRAKTCRRIRQGGSRKTRRTK
jgi:hypothetical protein